jgi:hypothetical protein
MLLLIPFLSFFRSSVWSAEHISWLKQGVKYVYALCFHASPYANHFPIITLSPLHPFSRFIAPMATKAGPRLGLSTRFRLSVRPDLYGRSGLSSKLGHNAMTCITSVFCTDIVAVLSS